MAIPMMRHPGLLAQAQYLQMPYAGLLSPQPMGPGSGFDPWPTKPGPTTVPSSPPVANRGGLLAMIKPEIAENPLYQAFDGMRNTVSSTLLNSVGHKSSQEAVRGAAEGAMAGLQVDRKLNDQRRKDNATLRMLEREDPELAEWVRTGAATGGEAFQIFAADRKARASLKSGDRVFGTPIYGTDAQGNTVVGVIGKDGTFQRLDTGGVTPTPGVTWQDFGTYQQPFGKGGQPVGPRIENQNYGKGFDTTSGQEDAKADAARRANLPKVEATAAEVLSTLDNIEKHPGLAAAVGWQGNIPDWLIPAGTQTADFMSHLSKAQGQAFLQAFESLKGGGQITQIEGEKATQAISRLSRQLSEPEFRAAIKELRETVTRGLDRARRGVVVDAEGREMPAPLQQSAPGVGAPFGAGGRRTSNGVNWSLP